ncbi:YdcF family protein [Blautia sp. CLA-JM-H16]|uniref:YdcF family protein n=1 Tax=Blautia aquisgranensis TaxID=3133153 RepID=A0ABV1BA21_9FIRM
MYGEFLKQIEDFIFIEDKPEKADVIFIPGNGYPQMAERAAQLYRQGLAPKVLPSGKYSVTLGKFAGVLDKRDGYNGNYETEWGFLKDVLIKNGVPESAILKEEQATFTYENAIYSRQVTDREHLDIQKAILCCKTCHARRALMYYKLLYPDTEFFVSSCCVDSIDKDTWRETNEGIDEVMGEITRIIKQFSLMLKKN